MVSGQRRYDEQAVRQVGAVALLREVGLSLDEIGRVLRSEDWQEVARNKIAELDEQATRLQVAREALEL